MIAIASSEILQREATSTFPGRLTVVLVIWVGGVVLVRQLVLVDRTPADTVAHTWVALSIVTVVLRDSTVQHALIVRGVSLSDIRSLTHTIVLLSAAALAVLGLLWERKRLPYRYLPYWLVAGALVLSAALWVIALPARSEGIAVEELQNWRTAAYMTLYSLPTPIAEIPALITAVAMLRERATRARLLFGLLVFLAIAGSWTDHLTRLASGWSLAFGDHNEFTAARAGSNDALFLPILAFLVMVGIPNIVTSLKVRVGRDAASTSVKLLAPMWRTLTSALPEYRLVETHSFNDPAEVALRIRVEIDECVVELAGWLPEGSEWPHSPEGRAKLLETALGRYRSGVERRHSPPPEWLRSDRDVDEVARVWRSGHHHYHQQDDLQFCRKDTP